MKLFKTTRWADRGFATRIAEAYGMQIMPILEALPYRIKKKFGDGRLQTLI